MNSYEKSNSDEDALINHWVFPCSGEELHCIALINVQSFINMRIQILTSCLNNARGNWSTRIYMLRFSSIQ